MFLRLFMLASFRAKRQELGIKLRQAKPVSTIQKCGAQRKEGNQFWHAGPLGLHVGRLLGSFVKAFTLCQEQKAEREEDSQFSHTEGKLRIHVYATHPTLSLPVESFQNGNFAVVLRLGLQGVDLR